MDEAVSLGASAIGAKAVQARWRLGDKTYSLAVNLGQDAVACRGPAGPPLAVVGEGAERGTARARLLRRLAGGRAMSQDPCWPGPRGRGRCRLGRLRRTGAAGRPRDDRRGAGGPGPRRRRAGPGLGGATRPAAARFIVAQAGASVTLPTREAARQGGVGGRPALDLSSRTRTLSVRVAEPGYHTLELDDRLVTLAVCPPRA
jgi:hypothetical protein